MSYACISNNVRPFYMNLFSNSATKEMVVLSAKTVQN